MAAATKAKSPKAAASTKTQAKAVKKEKTPAKKVSSTGNTSSDSVVKASIRTSEDHVDAHQLQRALDALLQHETKKRSDEANKELFESDVPIQIQIGLLKPPGYAGPKPHRILLPHASRTKDDEAPEVCLIVKDSSKEWLQELLPHFPSHLGCIKKILTLTSLRTKHHTFAQRRALVAKYSHFLGDDRILPMLPAALGKEFYRHRKLVPVNLTRKEALPFTIQKALASTHLKTSKGTCWTIAIGTIKHSSKELLENALAAISQSVEHVPQQWKNVLSLCLKTPSSMALPFYNQLPEQLLDLSTLRSEDEIQAELASKQAQEAEKRKERETAKKEKRVRAADDKSPLLRALKKQKATEEAKSDKKTEETGKVIAKATKAKDALKAKASSDTPASKTTKSELSKKEAKAAKSEALSDKKKQSEAPKGADKKTAKRVEPELAEKTSSKKAKKTPERAVAKETAVAAKSPFNASFMASSKFSGSKKGFVFKKGPQGVGYYKDQPPVVDNMAMEAILRMAKTQGGGGGRKKQSGGGFKGKKQHSRGRR